MAVGGERTRPLALIVFAGVLAVAMLAVPRGTPRAGSSNTAAPSPVNAGLTAAAASADLSRYVPIRPIRVIDTRTDPGVGRVSAGGELRFQPVTLDVAAAAAVAPPAVAAVVMNVTAIEADDRGFVTVYPDGEPRPTASSLNTQHPGHTVPNLVTVPLGTDGRVTIYAQRGMHLAVDVQGVYERAITAAAGRFVPMAPVRALDTRVSGTSLAAGGVLTTDLTSVGLPATASAAVLNVTATNTLAKGFYTVWSGATPRPNASNLNVPGAAATIANQVITEIDQGRISVYAHTGGDVIVDVVAYMTGPGDPIDDDGLFVPVTPARLVDTRECTGPTAGAPVVAGGSITVDVAGRAGIPTNGVLAGALNVTATGGLRKGFVTSWPTGLSRPDTSTLNLPGPDRTVPNHAVTSLGGGAVDLFTSGGTHLIADVTGYWTGEPPAALAHAAADLTTGTSTPPPTTAPAATAPCTGPHSFLYQSAATPGQYARWNPCSTITYAVNAERAVQEQVDRMNEAIATIEQATGLDFEYVGDTTSGTVAADVLSVPHDAIIAFSDEATSPALAGGKLGVGGGYYSQSTGEVRKGYVIVDVVDSTGTMSGAKLRATLIHEIAHMVGLGHVTASDHIMYGFNVGVTELAAGDREGLWWLGAAQPCISGLAHAAPDGEPGDADPLIHRAIVD